MNRLDHARCAALVALAAVLAGCGATHRRTAAPTRAALPPPPAAHPRPKPPDSGSLPQTRQLPSAHTQQFRFEMAALWRGVTSGSPAAARAAFFPEGAYAQVKAYADPRADYVDRLLRNYALDVRAAHALVGSAARLVRVDVTSAYAHWVPQGACYNRVGYYEVPNARVVYRTGGGKLRSFGVASMISWRGAWYVIHLGAVDEAGVVDDPAVGPGAAAASTTC